MNKSPIAKAAESCRSYDIVGDLDQFQELMNKNRTLSKEKQRKITEALKRPACLNFEIPKTV